VIPTEKVSSWSAKIKVSAAAPPAAIQRRPHMQRPSSGTSASAAMLAEKINEWSAKIEVCHVKQLPAYTSELEAASSLPAALKTKVLLRVFSLGWQLCRTLGCLFVAIIASCISLQPPWLSEEGGGEHAENATSRNLDV
jgi:hypothetical protein